MFERIKQIIIKEFIFMFRDKRITLFLFLPPMVQLIIFGYAVVYDIKEIPTSFFDLDKSFESREISRRLEASKYFNIKYFPKSKEEVQNLLDRGKVTVSIQINKGFSKDLKNMKETDIQIILDGTDSNTATIAMDYLNKIISKFSSDLIKSKERKDIIDFRTRIWYNPDLKSRNYNVPAVIAIVVMLTCLLLTSMAIVREREMGTLEQLMVTPIVPFELILGKTLPFALIGFIDTFIVMSVGLLWFKIPFKGSIILLILSISVYLLSSLGIGLFISTISKTMQQAMMATFLFFSPAVLLSGMMFPIENMPEVIQYITYLNPLRYFLKIIRGIFLKANGIDILYNQILPLLGIGLSIMIFSSLRFKKRLE